MFQLCYKRLCSIAGLPLLVLAAFVLLTFHADQDGFPLGFNGYLSSHGATITSHLSGEHGWMMMERQHIYEDGPVEYKPYNRFPITSFLFLKAASQPFRSDPGAALVAMHQMMLLFLAASIFVAYRGFRHLEFSKAAAAGASLLGFSSFYFIYYGDMIFVDIPTLFGCTLALEGMALHSKTGNRRGLMWRALAGTAFGWQVLAFLLPYTAGLCFRSLAGSGNRVKNVLRCTGFQTGLAALLFAGSLLAANLWNEQRMTGKAWTELDSLNSASKRLGHHDDWNAKHSAIMTPGRFTKEQLARVGRVSLPHAVRFWPSPATCLGLGILSLGLCILISVRTRHKLLAVTALLSGFVWAIPMRHFVGFHDFQAIYYVGIPLLLYAGVFHLLDRKRAPAVAGAYIALLLFTVGSLHCSRTKTQTMGRARAVTEDFREILKHVPEGSTFATRLLPRELWPPIHGVKYFMTGRIARSFDADFLLDARPTLYGESLTPYNRYLYLFPYPENEQEILKKVKQDETGELTEQFNRVISKQK